ncbi:50S ribosomal protein L21, mitochondrial-like isoform X2 [Chenopodium quinoa]|uniref:50S ribosomal protein L21, mitochondrial-like isoform X2 n=1 Tax=Chenopodium quinoa TaxID=63459 RepID=UPI000B779AF1|nr:50S ribosomal protein L21, mitochondrial-like isoform X2 [Chenopodium quinoa]
MAALFFLGCCFSLFFSNDLQGLQCAPLSFCPHKCRKDVVIVLNKVLLVGTKSSTCIGMPIVTNASVNAVVEQLLDDKAIVFKYKNYRRNIGHRQVMKDGRIVQSGRFDYRPRW